MAMGMPAGPSAVNVFPNTPGMVTVDLAEWQKLNAFYYSNGGGARHKIIRSVFVADQAMLTRGEEGTFYVFGPLAVLSATLLSTTSTRIWSRNVGETSCGWRLSRLSGREGLCNLGG